MKSLLKLLSSVALSVVMATGAAAAPATVKASLDSTKMLMGRVNVLRLQVVRDEKSTGDFPLLRRAAEAGRATLLSDTVEIGKPLAIDTARIGSGRIQIDYQVPVQVFDSGTYVLPPFEYVVGKDTARSERLHLQIVPVKALATDTISPLAGQVSGKGASILDSMPDWLYYYWWTGILAILVALLVWWIVLRHRRQLSLIPKPVPVIDPADEALASLKGLKERKLWEHGMEKEYFSELTEILRHYLVRRFGINAMEMTSAEIMAALADSEAKSDRQYVRDVLSMADFVKFAKMRPLPADNVSAYNNVYDFVKATARPAAEVNTETGGESKDKIHTAGKEVTE